MAKKWVGSYNYSADPAVLPDNSMLARSIFQKQQKRLEKNGMLQQFNEVFEEAVSREVFTSATRKELEYTGPFTTPPWWKHLKRIQLQRLFGYALIPVWS
ncbi:MAG: hypothetical protein GY696_04190 [Gammaproteobacteria bacterium]|nr:hypothetical protein [Gammaproteobacteria bacterium]